MEITNGVRALWSRSVGDLVAEDYRRADVFRKHGIDYCCGGGKSLQEACAKKGVSCDEIVDELASLDGRPVEAHLDVRSWEPDFLASYIANVHHKYVRERIPVLRQLTDRVARVHGRSHPETREIAGLVLELIDELREHMAREEEDYFPYVESLCGAVRSGEALPNGAIGSVEVLEHEHDRAGKLMSDIRALSGGYDVSEAPCTTFRLAYIELENFEKDLHRHVHLENNVLFPAVMRIEGRLPDASDASGCACGG